MFTAIETNAQDFLPKLTAWAAQALPNVIAAVLFLMIGLYLASWAGRITRRAVENSSKMDNTFAGSLSSIVKYTVGLIAVVATLSQLGFETTSLIAALGAVGLTIGLALQATLANIAAGFMLLWLRPFRVGDYVEGGNGVAGTVREVGLFASELHSFDGVYQFVPNSELWNKRITNYSRLPTRMTDLRFGVAYEDDVARAQEILLETANADSRVLRVPSPPIAFVSSLDDSCVTIGLRAWVSTADYWPARRALTENAKRALEGAGMTIPFPQLDVHTPGPTRLNSL